MQELTVDRDRSSLFYVARALHGLQQQWGTIPHVKGKGDAAAAGERAAVCLCLLFGRTAGDAIALLHQHCFTWNASHPSLPQCSA